MFALARSVCQIAQEYGTLPGTVQYYGALVPIDGNSTIRACEYVSASLQSAHRTRNSCPTEISAFFIGVFKRRLTLPRTHIWVRSTSDTDFIFFLKKILLLVIWVQIGTELLSDCFQTASHLVYGTRRRDMIAVLCSLL